MTADDYAWMDHLPDADDRVFGGARLDLQHAENTFRADMPDQLLLRLYGFLLIREQEAIWLPLLHLCTGLILLRMRGPMFCPEKYKVDFGPLECDLAEEAIRSGSLPNRDLLSLHFTAEDHTGMAPGPKPAPHWAWKWKPIFALATEQVLSRMAVTKTVTLQTLPCLDCFFNESPPQIWERRMRRWV